MGATEEGMIEFGVGIAVREKLVVVNFNRLVSWVGISAEEARKLGATLVLKAELLEAAMKLELVRVRDGG